MKYMYQSHEDHSCGEERGATRMILAPTQPKDALDWVYLARPGSCLLGIHTTNPPSKQETFFMTFYHYWWDASMTSKFDIRRKILTLGGKFGHNYNAKPILGNPDDSLGLYGH